MGDARQEPSMEEILASIKRIIADDGAPTPAAPRARRGDGGMPASVLELVDPVEPEPAPAPRMADPVPQARAPEPRAAPAAAPEPEPAPGIVSEQAAAASRHSLAALSALVVRPEGGQFASLEDLVREMLRPMLKDWLDTRLPEIVEKLVAQEIARIAGSRF